MNELFQTIRFPVTAAIGALLIAALPVWFALGLVFGIVILAIGVAIVPAVLVYHAFTGGEEEFRAYLRGLVDFESYWNAWWETYTKRWAGLAEWQRTGR